MFLFFFSVLKKNQEMSLAQLKNNSLIFFKNHRKQHVKGRPLIAVLLFSMLQGKDFEFPFTCVITMKKNEIADNSEAK